MKLKKAKSSPKILSFDFVAQNYTDIIGSIVGLILLGLLFAPTSKLAFRFVFIQLDIGIWDFINVVFYTLICILCHAAIQTYLLDKSARRLHLSKIKNAKYSESGQLSIFYAASMLWGLELLRRDSEHGIKWYYIIQISYWVHCIPMYLLEKLKKEDLNVRASYVCLYIPAITLAYWLRITRISLILLVLHYASEALFHIARILYFRQSEIYPRMFKIWNVIFILVRLASTTLTFLVFFLGVGPESDEALHLSVATRYIVSFCGYALQAQPMWKYINFHIKRLRPAAKVVETKRSKRTD